MNQDVYRIGKCIFQRDCVYQITCKTSALLLVIFLVVVIVIFRLETFERQHNAGLSSAMDDIIALTRKCTWGAKHVSDSFSYILV